MPNPLETFQFSFQSLIYFFIQQVFSVYAQVCMILGPGQKWVWVGGGGGGEGVGRRR